MIALRRRRPDHRLRGNDGEFRVWAVCDGEEALGNLSVSLDADTVEGACGDKGEESMSLECIDTPVPRSRPLLSG